jgi:chromosome segregation ATPase
VVDVTERLDNIEQALATTNERLEQVNQRLDRHDERFNQIDERFNQIDERFNQIDQRFDQMDERFKKVDERFGTMDTRIDSLESETHKLRVLEEANSELIKVIAEVQSRHGEKLDELAKGLEPLKDLRDFIQRVAEDHERRITELETKQ